MAYHYGNEEKKKNVRTALRRAKRDMSYTELVRMFDVNRKELNKIINSDEYEPPAWVWVKLGVPVYELAPVCPVHGKACVLDCTKEKAVKKNVGRPTPRKRVKRAIAHPGTSPDKIARDLLDVTGDVWVRLVDELKY